MIFWIGCHRYKDGQLVSESPNIRLGVEGDGQHSLTIANVQWTDQGVYSVVAINCSGRSSSSATLTIGKTTIYRSINLINQSVNHSINYFIILPISHH